MKRRWLLAVLLFGCSESVHVSVDCITTAAPAVECTAVQKEGKSEVEACWDFSVTCESGGVVTTPRTCVKVKDGGTEKVTIGADKLTGIENCKGSKPPVPKLENLTLDGKPTTK